MNAFNFRHLMYFRAVAREGAGVAVLPPIVVKDELAQGTLVEATRLKGLAETFYAVTVRRRFPNPLVRDLLRAGANALTPGSGG